MNYNDQILENKAFNFFKQLVYNIAVAICIMLLGVLILVYGFKFKLYNVMSDSQAPVYFAGDMVVVKAQNEYNVGDILKFDKTETADLPTTHRLIYILEDKDSGTKYYVCHGDAVQNVDRSDTDYGWEDDSAYVKQLVEENKLTKTDLENSDKAANIQIVTESQIEGKVVAHASNYGTYITFIKEHYMLFIALIAGIWCISSVIQNEIDVKRSLRLL